MLTKAVFNYTESQDNMQLLSCNMLVYTGTKYQCGTAKNCVSLSVSQA